MAFLGMVLALSIILEIARAYKRLAFSLMLVLLAFGLTLAFLNVDRTIARQNIQHAQAGGKLDLAYLAGSGLSEDAAPELFAAFDDPALKPELKTRGPGAFLPLGALQTRQSGSALLGFVACLPRRSGPLVPQPPG